MLATVEIWVVVDENGDSAIGTDPTTAIAAYDENIGRADDSPVGLRFAKVLVKVPVPAPFELNVTAQEGQEMPSVEA